MPESAAIRAGSIGETVDYTARPARSEVLCRLQDQWITSGLRRCGTGQRGLQSCTALHQFGNSRLDIRGHQSGLEQLLQFDIDVPEPEVIEDQVELLSQVGVGLWRVKQSDSIQC